jgi:hypothetical protein
LALLLRVLMPEAALLSLHAHQHTHDEVTTSRTAKAHGKPVLSPKHQHCHAEQLYDAPFQPAPPVVLTAPNRQPVYVRYRPQAPVCRASHLLDGASLRGPPVRRA